MKILWVLCGLLALCGQNACTHYQVIKANAEPTVKPQQPIADDELLDVGIVVFDPGLSEPNQQTEEEGLFPAVRKAEARFIPHMLKTTLEETGYWGAVRVIPTDTSAVDVIVTGQIVASDGVNLVVEVEVRDASERVWLQESYTGIASKYSYGETDTGLDQEGPFQAVYNAIANDMAAARNRLPSSDLERIRTISELKFAKDFSPYAFDGYLAHDAQGVYTIKRLPARDDPMLGRVRSIRERDRMFLDVLDEHYAFFSRSIEAPYQAWREGSYQEVRALNKIERSGRNQMTLGAAAALIGLVGVASNNAFGSATGAASMAAGAAVFNRGLNTYSEAEMHREVLRELGDSLTTEVEPRVVEVEGKVITLTGSAEAQYREWRRLLQEIYLMETGSIIDE